MFLNHSLVFPNKHTQFNNHYTNKHNRVKKQNPSFTLLVKDLSSKTGNLSKIEIKLSHY